MNQGGHFTYINQKFYLRKKRKKKNESKQSVYQLKCAPSGRENISELTWLLFYLCTSEFDESFPNKGRI